jgi:glycosyltransferase involved in cell wall biosynthesis
MATFNGGLYIKKQLASILPQLAGNDELIISDDASTDDTVAIVSSINDPRITVLNRAGPRSIRDNFENAILHAKGEIIFLSDQDDIWHPQKISTMKKQLDTHLLVTCDCTIIDEQGTVLYNSFFDKRPVRHGVFNNLMKNSYVGCCMAFKREFIKSILPFPKKIPMHDWWIGLRAEMLSCSYFLPAQLVSLRHHSKNASPTARGQRLPLYRGVFDRIALLNAIIKAMFGTKNMNL